jgi:hypothetical protein
MDDSLCRYLADSQALAGYHQATPLIRTILRSDTSRTHPIHAHAHAIRLARHHQGPITLRAILAWHRTLLGPHASHAGILRMECPSRWPWPLISVHSLLPHLLRLLHTLTTQMPTILHAPESVRHDWAWRVHHHSITLLPFADANGRLARILMNTIRERLALPWISIASHERPTYDRTIHRYANLVGTAALLSLHDPLPATWEWPPHTVLEQPPE